MRKDYYFDSTLTPSLEAELQQMQKSIQIAEIRIVPAEPEPLPWFKGWAEVLTVVAVMGIAGLMLTGLIGGAMYFFLRFFHVAG